MTATRTAAALAALMCSASVISTLAQPPVGVSTERAASVRLDAVVPPGFGDWRIDPAQVVQVVNPQTQELLDKLYAQVLTRIYVNSRGYRIMLSLAYGSDQRGALRAHKPEVCYVAQGFNLLASDDTDIHTAYGPIYGRRMSTQRGNRFEPVTYWFTSGDQTVRSHLARRLSELRIGLTGQIPDGLLFRVSSIDTDVAGAYTEHDRFVNQLLAAVAPTERARLFGLPVRAD